MTPPVFLVDPGRCTSASVLLDGPEGRHAAIVRRIRVGERVDLTDGAGLLAECVVVAVDGAALRLDVLVRHAVTAPSPRLVVVQALPKGDMGERAVGTMTEVGVDAVVPWCAARCVTRWRAGRGEKALDRWRGAAREAAKQARRAWLPQVTEVATTPEVAARLRRAALGVVLDGEAEEPLARAEVPAAGDVVVVVGPEGGITGEELAAFDAAGARAYRLGPTILRTSTAGVAALAVLQARTSRWS